MLAGTLALVGTLLGSCGDVAPMPDVDLLVRVAAGKTTVRPGEGIPITVTRVWPRSHEPSPWDDAMLEPLILREPNVTRREDDRRVEETRTWRAYVFRLEDVRVPEVLFASRPKNGEGLSIARSTPITFTVVPELDAENPGAPELPGAAPAGPPPAWRWILVLALVILGFEVVSGRRRRRLRRTLAAQRAAPRVTLETVKARRAITPEALASDLALVVDAVRDHLALSTHVPARARTSEEILGQLLGSPRAEFAAVAGPADEAKFGARTVTPAVLATALERAFALVEGRP